MSTTHITATPEGENSVNPIIMTENAADLIKFVVEVFGGKTDEGALTYDEDGTIFHSETMVDKTKFIIVDRKKDWPFTPAFTQVYVNDVEATIERAKKLGATVITEPTEYVGVNFSRVQDPQGNIWWIWKSLEITTGKRHLAVPMKILGNQRKKPCIYMTLLFRQWNSLLRSRRCIKL